MGRNRHRHVFLFLGALILPCLVIALLGWRIVATERDRLENQRDSAEKRAVVEIQDIMVEQLERIKNRETAEAPEGAASRGSASRDPAVVLTAKLEGNRIVLPLDEDIGPAQFKRSVNEPVFARKIAEAEHAELTEGNYEAAVRLYRESVQAAGDSHQRTYGQFLLARTLARSRSKAGFMNDEARGIYLDLLKLPSTDVDDRGLPFAVYASARLVDAGIAAQDDQAVLDRVVLDLKSAEGGPRGAYVLKGILEKLRSGANGKVQAAAEEAFEQLSGEIAFLEQAWALQEDFASLDVTAESWQAYGRNEMWLIGMRQPTDSSPLVLAIRAADIFNYVSSDRKTREPGLQAQLVSGGSAGRPMGEIFPNLRAVFPANRDVDLQNTLSNHRWFYVLSLLIVVTFTFVAAYLIWRDTRREIRTANLRSEFVSSVSHELKTPLTSIRMFAETLQMGRSADPATHSQYLDTIVNESERLTRLLNNVLDFSRIEHEGRTYRLTRVRLDEVVEAGVRSMRYLLEQQGFNLHLQIAGGIPAVQADRDALEQAILNLLTNAVKYSGQSRDIELRLRAEGGQALIQVVDRGIGIPANEQARIFERFYRATSALNTAIPGAGLGLALVAHIAKGHGGTVEVQSRIDEGSTFTIRLPIPPGDAL